MKKLLSLFLATTVILTSSMSVFADTTITNDVSVLRTNTYTEMTFNNDILNVDGTTFFPLRELLNNLGVNDDDIYWDSDARTIDFSNDKYDVTFTVDEDTYTQNGVQFDMPVAPFIYNDLTYLPIRYVATSLGYKVGYDEGLRQVLITNVPNGSSVIYKDSQLPQLSDNYEDNPTAIIHTNYGNIVAVLYEDYAPLAVNNFIELSESGYYDGVTFHRVINDFVIQGGDPTGTGSGGESIYGEPFENEVSPSLRHFSGALCMANAGPNTNGSQFYIVENEKLSNSFTNDMETFKNNPYEYYVPGVYAQEFFSPVVAQSYIENGGQPSLDFNYTVFGQVISGMDTVHNIADVEVDEDNKPIDDVIITSIDILRK